MHVIRRDRAARRDGRAIGHRPMPACCCCCQRCCCYRRRRADRRREQIATRPRTPIAPPERTRQAKVERLAPTAAQAAEWHPPASLWLLSSAGVQLVTSCSVRQWQRQRPTRRQHGSRETKRPLLLRRRPSARWLLLEPSLPPPWPFQLLPWRSLLPPPPWPPWPTFSVTAVLRPAFVRLLPRWLRLLWLRRPAAGVRRRRPLR